MTQPEVARDVIETTKERAGLLGISIDEGTGESEERVSGAPRLICFEPF
ncbi:hypothetical protein [Reticulibacter mediterranei]|nr:hypothetical protein [Reticulibacter mediterranei]